LKLTTKPNVYSVSVDGVTNTPGSDADSEVVLDIEVIGGVCPNSNIYVYFAPNTDTGFYDAIHSAVYDTTHPFNVISISWGSPENYWVSSSLNAFNALFQQAAAKGINVFCAAGDNGASDGENSGLHVDFPASSPWVIACGGTRLSCPTGIYDKETTESSWGAYPEDGSATGGGISVVFARPSYQLEVGSFYSGGRLVPDISANADPATGIIIYLNGQLIIIGGTSAIAPLYAAYLGSLSYKKFLNETIYSLYPNNKTMVHDITVGGNNGYTSRIGYDPVTGLGTVNGSIFTPLLKN